MIRLSNITCYELMVTEEQHKIKAIKDILNAQL